MYRPVGQRTKRGESQRKHFRAKLRHQNLSARRARPLELAEVFFHKWFRKIVRQDLRPTKPVWLMPIVAPQFDPAAWISSPKCGILGIPHLPTGTIHAMRGKGS